MTKDQLATIVDAFLEDGAEDVAQWVQNPEAVRTLLGFFSVHTEPNGDYYVSACRGCGAYEGQPHLRACTVAEALRALGDERIAQDYDLAWAAAIRSNNARKSAATRIAKVQYAPKDNHPF